MSDTQDSMPAADAMPQSGEHSFNTKTRDGFAENGADEPTMSTADQENILLKEQMEKLKKFNVDMAAFSKRKAEADAEESEHKAKKAKHEAEKAVEELSLAQERKKIELSLAQDKKEIQLLLEKEKSKIETEKANDEAKKAKHEADLAVARTTKIKTEWGREDEKQTKEHERLLNYLDVQKQFDLVFTQGKAEEKLLKNREKQALLEHEQEVSRNGKPNEKAMVLKAQIERDMKAEHYKHEIKQYETRSEATQKLNTLVRETKGMTEDFESSLKSIDSFISGLLPKIREYNNVQAKSRDEEIVHLNKKAKIEADIAKSAADTAKFKTDAANKDARMSLPIGTRVKAIMHRQGSTEKRYRKGEIIGFSGDLFKVKFDDRAQQLFQDTPIDNIILYKPAPEPNPVDDAMPDDADL